MKNKFYFLSIFLIIMLMQTNVFSQKLVKDMNTTPKGADIEQFKKLGDITLFIANDGIHGNEIWKIDEITGETSLVIDAVEGTGGLININIRDGVIMNNKLFFVANESIHGMELWVTDGNEIGTHILKDINPGTAYAEVDKLTICNNMLYFKANNGINGLELWKSDGTEAGTLMVKDIVTGSSSSYPSYLTSYNNELYFSAYDGTKYNFWKTNGTEAGTVIVKNINTTGSSANPAYFTVFNNQLLFYADDGVHGQELWKSDGTDAGTVLLKDINTGIGNSSPMLSNGIIFNNELYFRAKDDIHGTEIWKTDGTEVGTVLLKDINPGIGDFNDSFYNKIVINGTMYFSAIDGIHGEDIWKTDGTTAGTVMVKDLSAGSSKGGNDSYYASFTEINNKLAFILFDAENELWISDGTDTGTMVLDNNIQYSDLINYNNNLYYISYLSNRINNGISLSLTDGTIAGTQNLVTDFTEIYGLFYTGNKLIFSADKGITGLELWQSNGTISGTKLLKDINIGTRNFRVNNFVKVNGITYFKGSYNGMNLYKTDGTDAGTVMVNNPDICSKVDNIIVYNNILIFSATSETEGTELWKSDGTEAGTVLIKDIRLNGNSYPRRFTQLDNKIYFTADDGVTGEELWVTDGSEAGTHLIKNINGISAFSNLSNLTACNGVLYFSANDGTHGTELWKSDGTEAGTVIVKDIKVGNNDSYPKNLFSYNNEVYFSAYDGTHGYELWKSNGTEAGTVLVKDINPTNHSHPNYFAILNSTLYFVAYTDNYELWKTDGTTAGTEIVKDNVTINSPLTVWNNTLYFSADNGTTGYELWKSDGTTAGTSLIKDINSGIGNSYIDSFTGLDNLIYFVANDGIHGNELWKTDGNETGTIMLNEIDFSNNDSEKVKNLFSTGTQLFFQAYSHNFGEELWEYTPTLQYATITSPPENNYICNGSDATFSITANNAISYQWQVDDGTGFINISSGTYSGFSTNTLTVTSPTADYSGYKYRCLAQNTGGNAISEFAYLYINNITIANAGTNAENTCGLTYGLNANMPTSEETAIWSITSGGTGLFDNSTSNTATFTANADNTYVLTWTITNGSCQSSSNVQVFLEEDNTNPTIICVGNQTVTANQFHVYVVNATEFDPTDIDDNCGLASTVNDFNSGNSLANAQLPEGMNLIEWTVTDSNGNTANCSYTITVNNYVGIENVSENGISIYPNPTNGIFTIQNQEASARPSCVSITDITGKIIINKIINKKSTTINLRNKPNGIYFVKVVSENKIYTSKVVINR